MIKHPEVRRSAWRGAAALALAGLLAVPAAAFAADDSVPDIATTFTNVPASIAFSSTTQQNYFKYTVTLTHYSASAEAFSSVSFAANAPVLPLGTSAATFIAVSTPKVVGSAGTPTTTCATLPATMLKCTFAFGTAAPFMEVGATISFDVTVQLPVQGSNLSGSNLQLNPITTWLEPDTGLPESDTPTPTLVPLTTPDPTVVSTYLPTPGATATTGTNAGAATCSQPWVTIVKVPAASQVGVNLNRPPAETVLGTGNFSQVNIPGQTFGLGVHWYDPGAASKLLTITLRRDACTIGDKDGSLDDALQILREKIYYKHDDADGTPYQQLYLCLVTSGPQPGQPCIASVKVYNKYNLPNVPNKSDYLGDHEWVIFANENGRFQN